MAVGSLLGLVHAVWSVILLGAPNVAQQMVDWKLALHGLSMPVEVVPFGLGTAVALVISTFIGGYVIGYVFAAIYNWQAGRK